MTPVRSLRKAGHNVYLINIQQWMQDTPLARRACSDADIIIIQRVMVEESLDRAKFWKEHGKAIVVDFDDSYGLISDTNSAATFWKHGKVEVNLAPGIKYSKALDRHPLDQFIRGVRDFCRGMTMPSRILAEDWQHVGPCWTIPNYIDSASYLKWKRHIKPDPRWIIIGYGGSMSHVPSFQLSGVEQALQQVVRKRDNVQVMICGDKRVYDRMPLPEARKVHQGYVIWSDWPKIMSQFDLSIAPLAGRYDDSRSAIKLTEASLMGLPIVATRSPAYQDYVERGVGEYVTGGDDPEGIPTRAGEWELKLLDMIDHLPEHRERMASHFDYAMSWDVDRNVDHIVATYKEIVNR